ncbi:TetR family transcriptional regulator [Paenibacillus sp. Soil766]|uniref:TetR/AcrR family transcriptional regulator n=1 Tax=Paenibacillus sp. Soil766 TaxID=1736404 RepID=UPI000710F730|nr:TetR/AcrR family transcriptional regulator [Paenibacillus sp. Soil766]KRF10228.1 TetR family transcriptional regulator [Paenibacillus sp. Soil766]
MKKETVKERILRVASDLFYREGIRSVGIDRIIEESGAAKASFYRSFKTKDDLIVAYLEARQELKLELLEKVRRLHPHSLKDQLGEVVQEVVNRMRNSDCRGCPFLNAVVEFPDPEHPSHVKALNVHQNYWSKVQELAKEGGARNPEELAVQLQMLYCGFAMKGAMDKSIDPDAFRNAAVALIDYHTQ